MKKQHAAKLPDNESTEHVRHRMLGGCCDETIIIQGTTVYVYLYFKNVKINRHEITLTIKIISCSPIFDPDFKTLL